MVLQKRQRYVPCCKMMHLCAKYTQSPLYGFLCAQKERVENNATLGVEYLSQPLAASASVGRSITKTLHVRNQEALTDKLVWFNWEGYPRWPGIVVPPKTKNQIVACLGHFYPPHKKIVNATRLGSFRNLLTAFQSCANQFQFPIPDCVLAF